MKREIEIIHTSDGRMAYWREQPVFTSQDEIETTHYGDIPEGIDQPYLPSFTPENIPPKEILITKEIIHKTPHFHLSYQEFDTGSVSFDYFVLNPGNFDLVEPIGTGVLFDKQARTDNDSDLDLLNQYLKKLNRTKSEDEKEKILHDLYFIFTESPVVDSPFT